VVLAGGQDEAFVAENFAGEFKKAGSAAPVILVPGLSHVGLTLDPRGIQAITEALQSFTTD
jgi:hypothetical protein